MIIIVITVFAAVGIMILAEWLSGRGSGGGNGGM